MKIRNGFVSNSSSSSFVICGTRTNFDDCKNENSIWVTDRENNEGIDVIYLTDEMWNLINENRNNLRYINLSEGRFYKDWKYLSEDGSNKTHLTKEDLHKEIITIDKSYHSVDDDTIEFSEYYIGDEDD